MRMHAVSAFVGKGIHGKVDPGRVPIRQSYGCRLVEILQRVMRVDFESDVTVIGGPGCIVEIDETLAVKRKNNTGRVLTVGWLFGGIERRDDTEFKCFMHLVYNRSEPHLTHMIRQHVAPGTTIITDGWPAYRNLGSAGYTHRVVIHEENFVSPIDQHVHTQRIESTWSSLMRFIRRHGTNKG